MLSLAPFVFTGGKRSAPHNSIGLEAYAFLVFMVLTAVEIFKALIGKTSKTSNAIIQIFSWEIGAVTAWFLWLASIGPLSRLTGAEAAIYGLLAALTSNGVAVTRTAKNVFNLFKKK